MGVDVRKGVCVLLLVALAVVAATDTTPPQGDKAVTPRGNGHDDQPYAVVAVGLPDPKETIHNGRLLHMVKTLVYRLGVPASRIRVMARDRTTEPPRPREARGPPPTKQELDKALDEAYTNGVTVLRDAKFGRRFRIRAFGASAMMSQPASTSSSNERTTMDLGNQLRKISDEVLEEQLTALGMNLAEQYVRSTADYTVCGLTSAVLNAPKASRVYLYMLEHGRNPSPKATKGLEPLKGYFGANSIPGLKCRGDSVPACESAVNSLMETAGFEERLPTCLKTPDNAPPQFKTLNGLKGSDVVWLAKARHHLYPEEPLVAIISSCFSASLFNNLVRRVDREERPEYEAIDAAQFPRYALDKWVQHSQQRLDLQRHPDLVKARQQLYEAPELPNTLIVVSASDLDTSTAAFNEEFADSLTGPADQSWEQVVEAVRTQSRAQSRRVQVHNPRGPKPTRLFMPPPPRETLTTAGTRAATPQEAAYTGRRRELRPATTAAATPEATGLTG